MNIELVMTREEAATESGRLAQELAVHLNEILQTVVEKNSLYGGAWRQQGWMGNLARMMSKVARLRSMCWRSDPVNSQSETVEDTARDLIAIAGFFLINRRDCNRWGSQ